MRREESIPMLARVGQLAVGTRMHVRTGYVRAGISADDPRLTLIVTNPFHRLQAVRWGGDGQIRSLTEVNRILEQIGLIWWPGRTCDIWSIEGHGASVWEEAEAHR
jgi:hypothetical protein